MLAAQADARWEAKESFLDSPKMQQPQPALGQEMNTMNPNAPQPDGNYETLQETASETSVNQGVPSPAQASKAQRQKMADTTVGKIGPLDRNPERMRVPEGPKSQVFKNPGAGIKPEGPPQTQADEIREAQKERPTEPLQPRQVNEEEKKDPWAKAQAAQGIGRSTEWQPKAWTPPAATSRR